MQFWRGSWGLALAAMLAGCNGEMGQRPLPPGAEGIFPQLASMTPPSSEHEASVREKARQSYAMSCAAAIAEVPEFDCTEGAEIKVYTDRGFAPYNQITEANASENCRNPSMLADVATACMPGSRIQRLRPCGGDIAIVALCRKYSKTKGDVPQFADHEFNDIAVIAHNKTTGATCFFNSYTTKGPQDGTKVPSPTSLSKAAAAFWVPPKFQPNASKPFTYVGYDCTNCHDADPFILSTYLAEEYGKLGIANPKGPYKVDIGGEFSPDSKVQRSTPDSQQVPGDAVKFCKGCHRIGNGSLHAVGRSRKNPMEPPRLHGFMPLGNKETKAEWSKMYDMAVSDIMTCLKIGTTSEKCAFIVNGTADADPSTD